MYQMNEFIKKLTSYNFLNYLFPGILFVLLLNKSTRYNLIHENIFYGVFLYYFIGLILSRIGSLIIQPIFSYFKFIQFNSTSDYLKASKNYPKIEILSETNNMIRSLCSVFITLSVFLVLEMFDIKVDFTKAWIKFLFSFLILIVLVLSFRKQTKTINERIEIILGAEN